MIGLKGENIKKIKRSTPISCDACGSQIINEDFWDIYFNHYNKANTQTTSSVLVQDKSERKQWCEKCVRGMPFFL